MAYPKALPHDPLQQIADDLFVVHGCVQLLPIARITRNMTVVRHDGELTLINAVRMDEAGLRSLEALGTVSHVLRLGPLHGMDDAFYVEHYQADFWSFTGGTTYTNPTITRPLADSGALPFPNASILAFNHMTESEGVIHLERAKGVLITCDAIQSYSVPPHMPYTGWLAKRLLPLLGFTNETIIGPIWLKKMVTDLEGIKSDFERLLSRDFDQLISGHGTFVAQGAHAEVEQAFAKAFS